jgi:hypothetical protein
LTNKSRNIAILPISGLFLFHNEKTSVSVFWFIQMVDHECMLRDDLEVYIRFIGALAGGIAFRTGAISGRTAAICDHTGIEKRTGGLSTRSAGQ